MRGSKRPSQLFLGVREVSPEAMMPLVLINPKITESQGEESDFEGCLSFPGINTDIPIPRASSVHVSARGLDGNPLQFTATGLLSRAVQHELDHLNGILFIDRMSADTRKRLEPELNQLEKRTRLSLKKEHKKS